MARILGCGITRSGDKRQNFRDGPKLVRAQLYAFPCCRLAL